MSDPLRVAMLYDMDACYAPTGVTRHALAQLERLRARPEITFRLIAGRITHPDGLAYWESLEDLPRRELPLRTRDVLRWWRIKPWPPIEWWTGPIDWVYCPAEFLVATRGARRAVTSHDVLQTLQFESARKRALLGRVFEQANLILSVSRFNTDRLLEAYPACKGRVAYVPNGADDLFFEPATKHERNAVRDDLGLPPQMPYLLSVANFQPRKNLMRLIHAAVRIPEVSAGNLALVLIGTGDPAEALAPARSSNRDRPAGIDPYARLSAGPGAAGCLCGGNRPGLSLALRELRHSGPGGNGSGRGCRAGRLDRPARNRRGRWLVFQPGRRGCHHRHASRATGSPRGTQQALHSGKGDRRALSLAELQRSLD